MSFSLTIPVSMSHHYVNSHYYGNPSPSFHQHSSHGQTQVPAATNINTVMMPPGYSMEATHSSSPSLSKSPQTRYDDPPQTVLSIPRRTVPVRKQSVFVAPSGISAICAPDTRSPSVSNVPYTSQSTLVDKQSQSQPHTEDLSSMLMSRSNWSSSHHPLDLSESSSNRQHHPHVHNPHQSVIRTPSSSSSESPQMALLSREVISQHISKIIQKNQAIIEPYEHHISSFRHQSSSSSSSSSRRSMSTTQLPSMQPQVQLSSSPCTGANPSTHPHALLTYQSARFDSPMQRRYSSDVSNVNSYSKLQSALLGEGKSYPEIPHTAEKQRYLGRKYSENVAHHPLAYSSHLPNKDLRSELSKFSAQQVQQYSNLFYPHSSNELYSADANKASVIMHPREYPHSNRESLVVMPTMLPINESSSSSSEPSLVRNLLTSNTSPFAHLASSNSGPTFPVISSASSGNSDSSIIKDLLLNSKSSTTDLPEIASTPSVPPHKKSRTESFSEHGSPKSATLSHTQQSNSSLVYTCNLCYVVFRNQQNLEGHQKYYCRGNESSDRPVNKSSSSSSQSFSKRNSFVDNNSAKPTVPERKVSVLERPSIITYTNNENSSSSTSSSLPLSPETHLAAPNESDKSREASPCFGNILKSKLLTSSSDVSSFVSYKRRKISEPAFRYNYDSKHRDSFNRLHQIPSVQTTAGGAKSDVKSTDSSSSLEILPAYTPYLMRPATKITIKPPVLFPVLQKLVETCTNHEFAIDQSTSLSTSASLCTLSPDLFSSKQANQVKVEEDKEEAIELTVHSSLGNNDAFFLTTKNEPSTNLALELQVKETLNHVLDQVEQNLADLAEESLKTGHHLYDQKLLLSTSPQATSSHKSPEFRTSNDFNFEVTNCLSELIETVANKMTIPNESRLIQCSESETKCVNEATQVVKKCSPTRPTTLDLGCSYNQSARNKNESAGTNVNQLRRISKLSIFLNRCSNQDEMDGNLNKLVASTLVSPDTPRPKRKYQQLFISGNAYTNLGLKVTTRPTYCCIFRAQPMFVTQEANPQLSMYSQWKTLPVPSGDILEHVRTPLLLMSAYNSQEAVYMASQSRLNLVEVATAATMGGLEHAAHNEEDSETERPLIREFLDKISNNIILTSSSEHERGNECLTVTTDQKPSVSHTFDRSLHALLIPIGDGSSTRVADTSTRSQFVLTHSSYHRLSQSKTQQQRSRKRSRSHNFDLYKYRLSRSSITESPVISEMAICSVTTASTEHSVSMSSTEQLAPTDLSSAAAMSTHAKMADISNTWNRSRKRSSTMSTCSTMSSIAFNPLRTLHPMLGYLPSKSKQAMMYILMMSQTTPVLSVPSVGQMASSKHFASRKFSECIGMRNNMLEDNWATKIGPDGSPELVPKRIKIFEGGFKSNEDYTYIRGRGRGKYVCEECGIRCKKPSMLKKHIRTHTDLRPYSCRHCAFAFKTKGNLTKHMKSKAHHKKCVELGIFPVPTTIEDSQIDNEALAKQEQYELNTNSFNQFADEDDDCDEDFDDEELDEDEDDDDEGVPIPLIEQQRLTYIEPGQFDDAETDKSVNSICSRSPSKSRRISEYQPSPNIGSVSASVRSSSFCVPVSVSIAVNSSSITSTSPALSITGQQPNTAVDDDDKASGKISSSYPSPRLVSPLSQSTMINSPNRLKQASCTKSSSPAATTAITDTAAAAVPSIVPVSDCLIIEKKRQLSTNLQSYHAGRQTAIDSYLAEIDAVNSTCLANSISSSNVHQNNITHENEEEAARSLLILSGVASNSESASIGTNPMSATTATVLTNTNSGSRLSLSSVSEHVVAAPAKQQFQHDLRLYSPHHTEHKLPVSKNNSPNFSDIQTRRQHRVEPTLNPSVSEQSASSKAEIVYEVASNSVLLAQKRSSSSVEQPYLKACSESSNSQTEMMRRSVSQSQVEHHTSHPTSVIMSHPHNDSESRKKSRHEHIAVDQANPLVQFAPDATRSAKSVNNLHNISSLISTPTLLNNSPLSGYSIPINQAPQILPPYVRFPQEVINQQQQFQLQSALHEIRKRSLQNNNEPIQSTSRIEAASFQYQTPSGVSLTPSNVADIHAYQRHASHNNAQSGSKINSAQLIQQICDNLKLSKQNSYTNPPNQPLVITNCELSDQRSRVNSDSSKASTFVANQKSSHILPNNNLRVSIPSNTKANSSHLSPNSGISLTKMSENEISNQTPINMVEKDTRKSPHMYHQHRSSPSIHKTSSTSQSSPGQHFSMPTNISVANVSNHVIEDMDQPMDLSKTSSKSTFSDESCLTPEKEISRLSPNVKSLHTPNSSMDSNQSSPRIQHSSPRRPRYQHLIEEQHITEQIARAFSPFADMQSLPSPKTPTQQQPNGHEVYKSVRSEDFVHLTPGIHTPHRLSKNIQQFYLTSRNASLNVSPNAVAGVNNASMSPLVSLSSMSSAQSKSNSATAYTTSEGKSSCPTCMKQFSKPAQLRLHLNIHLFERPFRCDSCGVSFRTKGHLQKHSRSVSHLNKLNMSMTFGRPSSDNPRPFKCSDCKIAFRIHGHLAKHLRSKSHIMKLECLGRLPFGMYAEMERSNINLNLIDTTDCDKSLESLRSLAQKLYDPRQMCWKVPDSADQAMDDVIEEDVDEEMDGEVDDDTSVLNDEENSVDTDDHELHSVDGTTSQQGPLAVSAALSRTSSIGSNSQATQSPLGFSNDYRGPSPPAVELAPVTSTITSTSSSVSAAVTAPVSTRPSISGLVSTRSNTCHLCGRLFKGAKFLQIHLYSTDHSEMNTSENSNTVATTA